VTSQELRSLLELNNTQLDILCEVLGALSVLNGAPPNRPPAGFEQLFAHEVLLFLFAQLFSKETQRGDNMEVWPETGPMGLGASLSGSFGDGLMSPTRAMTVRTTTTAMPGRRGTLGA
jgi:hypothetical protein